MSDITKSVPQLKAPSQLQLPLLPEGGFIRLPAILHLIPVGKSTWWAGVASGRFPKGVKLGPKTTAWRCEDIRRLLDDLGNGGDV